MSPFFSPTKVHSANLVEAPLQRHSPISMCMAHPASRFDCRCRLPVLLTPASPPAHNSYFAQHTYRSSKMTHRRPSKDEGRKSIDSSASSGSGGMDDYQRMVRDNRLSTYTSGQRPLNNGPNQGHRHDRSYMVAAWMTQQEGAGGHVNMQPTLGAPHLQRTQHLRFPGTSGRPVTPPSAPTTNYSRPMDRNVTREQSFSVRSERNSIEQNPVPGAASQPRHRMIPTIAPPPARTMVESNTAGQTRREFDQSQQHSNVPRPGPGQTIPPPCRPQLIGTAAAQDEAYRKYLQSQEPQSTSTPAISKLTKKRHVFTSIFRRQNKRDPPAGTS